MNAKLAEASAASEKAPKTPAEQRAAKAEAAKAARAAKLAIAEAKKKASAKAPSAVAVDTAIAIQNAQAPLDPRVVQMARLADAAQRGIDFTVATQSALNGGWRYEPGQVGDTSVVGWQSMALKAGLLAGLRVPPATLIGVSNFLDSVQSNYGATYGYLNPPHGSPATNAIGLLLRMHFGWPRGHQGLTNGVLNLAAAGPSHDDMYYDLYASLLLRNYGGPVFQKWNIAMREHLVATQNKLPHVGGSWFFDSTHVPMGGRLYNTVLATLVLEVYYRYEPIFPTYNYPGEKQPTLDPAGKPVLAPPAAPAPAPSSAPLDPAMILPPATGNP